MPKIVAAKEQSLVARVRSVIGQGRQIGLDDPPCDLSVIMVGSAAP
jgi:hypothetical protein